MKNEELYNDFTFGIKMKKCMRIYSKVTTILNSEFFILNFILQFRIDLSSAFRIKSPSLRTISPL